MDPNDSSSMQILKSPGYPAKYGHNQDCNWILKTAPGSQIGMVFESFNIEWSKTCKTKDFLYVAKIKKYNKVYLCGARLPKKFQLRSKANEMILRFYSNGATSKPGFRAILVVN